MPYLQSGTVQLLLETYQKSPKTEPIVVPVRDGSYGHPVIFHHRYFQEMTELKGDTGARPVIQAHLEHIIEVPTEDPGIERDIDRPEEMEPPKG